MSRRSLAGLAVLAVLVGGCFPTGYGVPATSSRRTSSLATHTLIPVRHPRVSVYSDPGFLGSIGPASKLVLTAEEVDSTTLVVFRPRAPWRSRSSLDSPVLVAQSDYGEFRRFYSDIGPLGEPALGARPALLALDDLDGSIKLYTDPGPDPTAILFAKPVLIADRNLRGDLLIYADIGSNGSPPFGARPVLIAENDGVGTVKVFDEIGVFNSRPLSASPVLVISYEGTMDQRLLTVLILFAK